MVTWFLFLMIIALAGGCIWSLSRLSQIALAEELCIRQNNAVAIAAGGVIVSVVIGLAGLRFGALSEDWQTILIEWTTEGILATVLLMVGLFLTDRLILRKFSIRHELVADQNLGVAMVVASTAISSGLIINGALVGFSPSLSLALRDILVCWLMAQGVIWMAISLMNRIRPFDFISQLEESENVASGVSIGTLLISLGILSRGAILYAGRADFWPELGSSLSRLALSLVFFVSLTQLAKLVMAKTYASLHELELSDSSAPVIMFGTCQVMLASLTAQLLQRPL